ncbi:MULTISPECIES: ImmA/IrrE family metallo-endopeptidase [unclassified Rhizobium]|uniref:ImmA/IrrE family metallo-endopeptidase n=1 Tax=unclassified Rhizobium TaxID=2613769 RepID=UPI000DDFA0DF|nr:MULTISPECIES: ImmA/IrrE family metallo-endopeptidase [unclassified Rhizobium]MCZ3378944.1 ImmA/IrrE family metallo-endopeptidase [Rhizobium sp. AG207R]TWB19237.1 uncharacterized protein DUF955 [Rhizobium sp. ERR1071]
MTSAEWQSLAPEICALLEKHQQSIPVKLGELAHDLGLTVKAATLDVGISGEIAPDPDVAGAFKIRINRHEVKTRQRFTLAHEIAHFLLHRDRIGNGIMDNILYRSTLSDKYEAEANRLAADILMPEAVISEWRREKKGLAKREWVHPLAELFGVSEDAMSIRLGLK